MQSIDLKFGKHSGVLPECFSFCDLVSAKIGFDEKTLFILEGLWYHKFIGWKILNPKYRSVFKMPKGVKRDITYTGKAAELDKQLKELEAKVKETREARNAAYKEQLKQERAAAKNAAAAEKKATLKAVEKALSKGNKSAEEIIAFLNENQAEETEENAEG